METNSRKVHAVSPAGGATNSLCWKGLVEQLSYEPGVTEWSDG